MTIPALQAADAALAVAISPSVLIPGQVTAAQALNVQTLAATVWYNAQQIVADVGTTPPPPPPPGSNVDHEGASWTLGAQSAYGFMILRNGVSAGGGQGSTITVSGGVAWVMNNRNQWFTWSGGPNGHWIPQMAGPVA